MKPDGRQRERRMIKGIDCPFCLKVTAAVLLGLAALAMLGAAGTAILLWGPVL
jgi:hypothetical protein